MLRELLFWHVCVGVVAHSSVLERLSQIQTKNERLSQELMFQKDSYDIILKSINSTLQFRQRRTDCEANNDPIVFHARQNDFLNPIGQNQIIVYDSLVTNVGGVYDRYNGLFKAPYDGLYQFIATAWSTPNHFLLFEIVRNNVDLCYGRAGATGQAMGICTAIVELSRGDKVWVRHQGTGGDYSEGKYFPDFAGHLIL